MEGIKQLTLHNNYKKFIDLCGQLRFQERWAHLHRIPKTSVLGHSLFVAILCYIFSKEIKACKKRIYNNFFTGLFHDLPEVLTRDIISPVKSQIKGLDKLIKKYEKNQMKKIVYPLLKLNPNIIEDIKFFTENEFKNFILKNKKRINLNSTFIDIKYNYDRYCARDGVIVKACDDLAAFIEAKVAIDNHCIDEKLFDAKKYLKDKYSKKNDISGINFGEIYTSL